MFESIDGSCSLLLLQRDGIYAARDRMGYSSLAVARRGDAWAVASETSAFPNLGFTVEKYLEPGEIVLIDENGIRAAARAGGASNNICAFLWIYTGFPTSSYEGINVETVRERCGQCLARRDRDIEVDVVAGIPDSGIGHALGYAMESGKPFRRPLVKYTPGYGRSYTPPSQETRDLVAKMKLIPNAEIIKGNRIVICEDSIVRGTQLKNYTVKKLWEAGAREVHVRPACPPLMFPCRFNLSTRSIDELAARRAIRALEGHDIDDVSEYIDSRSDKYRRMVEWIARDLEVTTLRYQTLEDMIAAIGLPKEKLCLYCWTGEYPAPWKREAGRRGAAAGATESGKQSEQKGSGMAVREILFLGNPKLYEESSKVKQRGARGAQERVRGSGGHAHGVPRRVRMGTRDRGAADRRHEAHRLHARQRAGRSHQSGHQAAEPPKGARVGRLHELPRPSRPGQALSPLQGRVPRRQLAEAEHVSRGEARDAHAARGRSSQGNSHHAAGDIGQELRAPERAGVPEVAASSDRNANAGADVRLNEPGARFCLSVLFVESSRGRSRRRRPSSRRGR